MNIEELTEDQLKELVAAVLYGSLKMLTDRGIPASKALRAVAVEFLQDAYGSPVWKDLGVATRTVERWRSELREAMALAPEIEEEPPAHVLDSFQRLVEGRQQP